MAFEYKVDNNYVTCNDAYYVLNSSYKKVTSAFMSVGGKYTPVFVSIVEPTPDPDQPTQTNHNVSVAVYNIPDGADYIIESSVQTSSGSITSDLTDIPAGAYVSIHVQLTGYSGSYSGNGWETGGSLPNYGEFDDGLGIEFTMPDYDLNLTLYLYCPSDEQGYTINWIDRHPSCKFSHLDIDDMSYTTSNVQPGTLYEIFIDEVGDSMNPPYVTVMGDFSGTTYFEENLAEIGYAFDFSMPEEDVTILLQEV